MAKPPLKLVPKRPRGRPAWVPPNLDQVEGLATRGMLIKEIALALGIHVSTLARKRNELKDFNDAITRGTAKFQMVLTDRLFKLVEAGDFNAIKFGLERRCGWTEKVEVGGKVEVDDVRAEKLRVLRSLTIEQRARLRQLQGEMSELLKGAGKQPKRVGPREIETTATTLNGEGGDES